MAKYDYTVEGKKVHLKILIDTRREKTNGTYPVKLRVTFNRERAHFGLDRAFTADDFERVCEIDKPRGETKQLRDFLDEWFERAKTITKELPTFTLALFKKKFLDSGNRENIFERFTDKINLLEANGQSGNASTYRCAYHNLKKYQKNKLLFADVTPDYLNRYETFTLSNGRSRTTISIYLRALRSIFNDAIADGTIKQELYPFGRGGYVMPAGRNTKKALSKTDIDKLKVYQCTGGLFEQRSLDLFLFSYYCNGMNMADVCRLRWRDIDIKNQTFRYVRQKTVRTKKESQTAIKGELRAECVDIINRWVNDDRRPDAYVFNFIDAEDTNKKQREGVLQVTKVTNKHLRRIASACGIEAHVTTYTARHSFATILMRNEAPIGFISQSLGHSNMKTTEIYLGDFDKEQTHKYLEAL